LGSCLVNHTLVPPVYFRPGRKQHISFPAHPGNKKRLWNEFQSLGENETA
jgi:hypothetical protein